MLCRQIDDQLPVTQSDAVRLHDEAAVRLTAECLDGELDLGGVTNVNGARGHAERRGDDLDGAWKEARPTGILSVQNECNAVYARGHLF